MREKPASITVIAILQFVFGGFGIIGGICGGVMMAAGGQNMNFFSGGGAPGQNQAHMEQLQKEMEAAMTETPAYQVVQITELTVELGLSLAMIASGIGLLQLRPWGRQLAIIYVVVSIGSKILNSAYVLIFTIPAFNSFLQTHSPNGPEEQMIFTMMRMIVYFPILYYLVCMIYPIIVFIIMFRPAVVAAFRSDERLLEDQYQSRSDEADYEHQ
jgi:hypothetical protein